MDIKLLSGALGAEISGISLKDSSDKNFKIINDLLLEHKVLFFRNMENSFNLIYRSTIVIVLITIFIILNNKFEIPLKTSC